MTLRKSHGGFVLKKLTIAIISIIVFVLPLYCLLLLLIPTAQIISLLIFQRRPDFIITRLPVSNMGEELLNAVNPDNKDVQFSICYYTPDNAFAYSVKMIAEPLSTYVASDTSASEESACLPMIQRLFRNHRYFSAHRDSSIRLSLQKKKQNMARIIPSVIIRLNH